VGREFPVSIGSLQVAERTEDELAASAAAGAVASDEVRTGAVWPGLSSSVTNPMRFFLGSGGVIRLRIAASSDWMLRSWVDTPCFELGELQG